MKTSIEMRVDLVNRLRFPCIRPGIAGNPLPTDISPGKHIQLRSQSMQQLEMWHSLYEKGAVKEEAHTQFYKICV